MNLKKTWDFKEGVSDIYVKGQAACKWIEIACVKLAPGKTASFDEKDKEFAVTVLTGTCDVTGDGFEFKNVGERETVFDGNAAAVYIPRNKKFTLTGVTEVTLVVAKTPGKKDHEPVLVQPKDGIVKVMGKPGWTRTANFIVDERVDADMVYVGECWVEGDNWASFPPHKHDEDIRDNDGNIVEAINEEIYYFQYDKPQGFGIQKVYTADGSVDETYTVKNGDWVEIPCGYHPCHVAPGYKNYYLWIMAGDIRGFHMTTDPEHAWLND